MRLIRRVILVPVGDGWGWAGSVGEFLSSPAEAVLSALGAHHQGLFLQQSSGSQVAAWRAELEATRLALTTCVEADPERAERWSVVFEYELPLEGGRRPDVVVLVGGAIVVVEFKSAAMPVAADIDQVRAYARDLADYHERRMDELSGLWRATSA